MQLFEKVKPVDDELTYGSLYMQERWFYSNDNTLFESVHRRSPYVKSAFRQCIDKIVDTLLNESPNASGIKLKNNSLQLYDKFCIDIPFNYEPLFGAIKQLKVYVHIIDDYNTEEDVYVLCADYDWSDYKQTELPLYQEGHHTIDVMSIVIVTAQYNKEYLTSVLDHELTHTIRYLKDKKTPKLVDSENKVSDALKNLGNIVKTRTRLQCGYYWSSVIYQLAQVCYFCQETEIEAHLQSAYNDYINSGSPEKEILDILRKPYDFGIDELSDTNITFYNYTFEYLLVCDLIKEIDNINNNFSYDVNAILKILHGCRIYKRKTLEECLLYWKSQLQKFLKRYGDMVLNIDENDPEIG